MQVQLGGLRPDQPPTHIAEALTAGGRLLGHRPAVTVLHRHARYEQSGASLANWAAKGAHLLELDHLVGPGSVVRLLAPPCWTGASVALATWWLGGTLTLSTDDPAVVTVAHPDEIAAAGAGHPDLLVGDGVDGAPAPDGPGRAPADSPVDGPSWTHEAQPMPDHPPTARASGDLPALRTSARTWNQAELLALAAELGDGTLGVEAGVTDPVTALVATSLHPLLSGHATVVLRHVPRSAATAERVRTWR
jgi:uncharacterized protein (TIGR03089 family)